MVDKNTNTEHNQKPKIVLGLNLVDSELLFALRLLNLVFKNISSVKANNFFKSNNIFIYMTQYKHDSIRTKII